MMVYDIGNPSGTMDLYKIKKAILQLMQVLLSQSINKIIFRGNKAPKDLFREKDLDMLIELIQIFVIQKL